MNEEAPAALTWLPSGGAFFALLAVLVVLGLLVHATLLRRIGPARLQTWTNRVEGTVFTLFLVVMIFLSSLQVVLRNLFHVGLLWIDPLVRILVLWLAFLGAMAATSHARHLHVDVVLRLIPEARRRLLLRVLSAASALVCAWLASAAATFLKEEAQFGSEGVLGIPAWAVESILLWGFALLCYRFLVQALWPAPAGEGAHA
ncbi:MAG: TRAP transporter small permease [Candidatus Eisenbacteria bacterium]|nr:TRAP transporter small permease subunit [Candidatus Eisenbacteria bacterium]